MASTAYTKLAFLAPVSLQCSTFPPRSIFHNGRNRVYVAGSVRRRRARHVTTLKSLMGWGEKKNGDGKPKADQAGDDAGAQMGSESEKVQEKKTDDLSLDGISEEDLPEDVKSEETTAEDILNSPAFLKKKLEIVQKELIENKKRLEELEEMIEKEKDNYMRLAADFKNFRRRSAEEMSKQGEKSIAYLCKEFLTVLDAFERASESVKIETEKEKDIHKSYQAINKQLLEIFRNLNVEAVDSVGKEFDPNLHNAIQRVKSDDYSEGIITEQYQRGYKLGENLIRPAMVVVSTGPGPGKEEEEADPSREASETGEDAGGVEENVTEESANGTASDVESEVKSEQTEQI